MTTSRRFIAPASDICTLSVIGTIKLILVQTILTRSAWILSLSFGIVAPICHKAKAPLPGGTVAASISWTLDSMFIVSDSRSPGACRP
jgi:hypothetical protein